MKQLLEPFKQTLQEIAERSTNADLQLAELKSAGMGKFNHVLDDSAGFVVRSNRFQPYVLELNEQYLAMQSMTEAHLKIQIPLMVNKIQLLLSTLLKFEQSVSQYTNSETK